MAGVMARVMGRCRIDGLVIRYGTGVAGYICILFARRVTPRMSNSRFINRPLFAPYVCVA